ncbi:MAG: transporter suffix domain-containing protein [Bacteroidales bacterium]|nr:transporter suffix domain-containing protein [Bacteroidales bacterium]
MTISCISFILIFIMPWFDYTKAQIAGITTVLIIIGEVLFYVSIFILGKAFYAKIKEKVFFWRPKPKGDEQLIDPENKDQF